MCVHIHTHASYLYLEIYPFFTSINKYKNNSLYIHFKYLGINFRSGITASKSTEYTVIMSTEDESSITEPHKNGKTDKYYKIPNCYA